MKLRLTNRKKTPLPVVIDQKGKSNVLTLDGLEVREVSGTITATMCIQERTGYLKVEEVVVKPEKKEPAKAEKVETPPDSGKGKDSKGSKGSKASKPETE